MKKGFEDGLAYSVHIVDLVEVMELGLSRHGKNEGQYIGIYFHTKNGKEYRFALDGSNPVDLLRGLAKAMGVGVDLHYEKNDGVLQ